MKPSDEQCILTQAAELTMSYLAEYVKTAVDCGTNIDLFKDLAGMRKDTDKNQYFISKGWRDGFGNTEDKITKCLCDTLEQWGVVNNSPNSYNRENGNKFGWERATATEIIEWHKKNEKL